MKKLFYFFLFIGGAFALSSCYKCVEEQKIERYKAEYSTRAELREGLALQSTRAIQSPGNIYVKGNHLYIVEVGKGVHIIDNSSPDMPTNIGFLSIPATSEIAMKNDVIIANSSTDLVSISIQNPESPVEIGRTESVFPLPKAPKVAHQPLVEYDEPDPSKGYFMGWSRQEIIKEIPCND